MQTTPNFGLKKPDYSDPADIQDINDNMDTLDSQAKKKQAAKSSPTASGTTNAFIDTISQDANGVITATKKTVRNAGRNSAGLIALPSGSGTTKYLREDGTWQVPPSATVTNNGPTLSWGNTSTVGSVNGTNLTVKMPANPNVNSWRPYQIVTYNLAFIGIEAGGGDALSATQVFTAADQQPPSGYEAVALAANMCTNNNLKVLVDVTATGNTTMLKYKNMGTSTISSCAIGLKILYLKTGNP